MLLAEVGWCGKNESSIHKTALNSVHAEHSEWSPCNHIPKNTKGLLYLLS
jgi:hypothetical protein